MIFKALYLCLFIVTNAVFNYEIGYRVEDKVSEFTLRLSKALQISMSIVNAGYLNISDYSAATRPLFYALQLTYLSDVAAAYSGFENGQSYCYGIDTTLPGNLYYTYTVPSYIKGKFTRIAYDVKSDGSPGNYAYNYTYVVTGRPWYKTAKSLRINYWTAPYIDAISGYPVISLIYPILNKTFNGKQSDFVGTIAIDVYLTQISTFLKSAYQNSDRDVFIVDKPTGSLLGSSLSANTSAFESSSNELVAVIASESTNSLISGVTKKLMAADWPTELLIYENHYLQSTLYVDSIYGLEWYLIVLLPAELQLDHLGPDSSYFYVVIALAVLAALMSLTGILVTIRFWQTKMVKLTQPVFTMMILFGGILLSAAALSLLGKNTSLTCGARLYLFNIAFTFTFAPLLIKSWRVHVLFNLNPLAKKKLITTGVLFFITLCFVLVDVLILVITNQGMGRSADPTTSLVISTTGAYEELTYCGFHNNTPLFLSEVVFKGSLIAVACYLSFKTRNVVGAIAGCKTLLAIVYNTAFTCAVIILITRSITVVSTVVVCESLGICFCVAVNAVLLVVPVVYSILVVGDAASSEAVMQSMFQHRNNDQSGTKYQHDGQESMAGRGAASRNSVEGQVSIVDKVVTRVTNALIRKSSSLTILSKKEIRPEEMVRSEKGLTPVEDNLVRKFVINSKASE